MNLISKYKTLNSLTHTGVHAYTHTQLSHTHRCTCIHTHSTLSHTQVYMHTHTFNSLTHTQVHTHTHTLLGEHSLKSPQDSGVAYKYIYSTTSLTGKFRYRARIMVSNVCNLLWYMWYHSYENV